jgi:hypothetical protein
LRLLSKVACLTGAQLFRFANIDVFNALLFLPGVHVKKDSYAFLEAAWDCNFISAEEGSVDPSYLSCRDCRELRVSLRSFVVAATISALVFFLAVTAPLIPLIAIFLSSVSLRYFPS